jgi:hypothetical protein
MAEVAFLDAGPALVDGLDVLAVGFVRVPGRRRVRSRTPASRQPFSWPVGIRY